MFQHQMSVVDDCVHVVLRSHAAASSPALAACPRHVCCAVVVQIIRTTDWSNSSHGLEQL